MNEVHRILRHAEGPANPVGSRPQPAALACLGRVGRSVNETRLYGVVTSQGYLLGNSRLDN